MLNTNLNTQSIYNVPAKNLSNLKAGLSINKQLVSFRGANDDDNETVPNTIKLTPKQRQAVMAMLLVGSQALFPSSGATRQINPNQVNTDFNSCIAQAYITELSNKKQFNNADIAQRMEKICPNVIDDYASLPEDVQKVIIANANDTIDSMQGQTNASAYNRMQIDPNQVNADYENCTAQASANKYHHYTDTEIAVEMLKICPEVLDELFSLPADQKNAIIANGIAVRNSLKPKIGAGIPERMNQTSIIQQPQQQQQNVQPKDENPSGKRMAQLPPGYKPRLFIPHMNIPSQTFSNPELIQRSMEDNKREMERHQKFINSELKTRQDINTCRDNETQEQCNKRALEGNLILDRMSILPQPSPAAQEIIDRAEQENQETQKSIRDSKIERMKIDP